MMMKDTINTLTYIIQQNGTKIEMQIIAKKEIKV